MVYDIRQVILEQNDVVQKKRLDEAAELERIVKKAGFSYQNKDRYGTWYGKNDGEEDAAQVGLKKDGVSWNVVGPRGDVDGQGASQLVSTIKKLRI